MAIAASPAASRHAWFHRAPVGVLIALAAVVLTALHLLDGALLPAAHQGYLPGLWVGAVAILLFGEQGRRLKAAASQQAAEAAPAV